jgi:hypothetical protein
VASPDFPVAVAPTTAMTCVPMPLVCPHPGGDVVADFERSGGVAQGE